jgi:hypothetical protein
MIEGPPALGASAIEAGVLELVQRRPTGQHFDDAFD